MTRLQPIYVLAHARSRRSIGDVASDLQTAGNTLLSDLKSSGCQQSSQQDVTDFQNAWNATQQGTGVPNLLKVDGLYGTNTQNALQSWANANLLGTVPPGCVAPAPTGGGGGSTSTSTSTTTTTTNNTTTTAQPVLATLSGTWMNLPVWFWLLGGVALAGALYETRERGPKMAAARRPSRSRRRMSRRLRRGRRRR